MTLRTTINCCHLGHYGGHPPALKLVIMSRYMSSAIHFALPRKVAILDSATHATEQVCNRTFCNHKCFLNKKPVGDSNLSLGKVSTLTTRYTTIVAKSQHGTNPIWMKLCKIYATLILKLSKIRIIKK